MPAVSSDAHDLHAALERLAPRIVAARDVVERDRRLPPELVDALRDTGVFRLCIPARLGGRAAPFGHVLRAIEQVAALDGAVGWVTMIGASSGYLAGYLPDDGGAEVAGDPRAILVGSLSPKGRAVPVPGGYRVSGRWSFASGIRQSTWVGGGCLIERAGTDGTPQPPQPVTMLFPTSEVQILDTWYSGGLRGTDSTDFTVAEQFVPARRVAPNGRPDAPDPASRVPFGTWGPPSVAAVGLGIARAAMDALIALATTRRGARRPVLLREQVLVQVQVGEAAAMLDAARLLLHDAADMLWERLSTTGELDPAQDRRLKLASAYTVDCTVRVVDRMHAAAGPAAVYSESPLDRCLRDIHVYRQHAALGVQHYEAAGRAVLGLPPAPPVA